MESREILRRGVANLCTTDVVAWLDSATETAATCAMPELLRLYTEVSRRVPHSPFLLDPRGDVIPDTPPDRFAQWWLVDAARASLLLSRAHASPPQSFADAVVGCYENADAGEQCSLLRAVDLFPDGHRFLPLVVDSCRTNILPNFEAVACENPYPARHFPEPSFNQLVLKALFNNVRLSRIVGLSRRVNVELARMAGDFAAERRAAGRPVPIDLAMAQAGATPQGTTV